MLIPLPGGGSCAFPQRRKLDSFWPNLIALGFVIFGDKIWDSGWTLELTIATKGSYPLGKVLEVTKSKDDLVRSCTVQYMTGDKKKSIDKSVNALVVIVPVDYKNFMDIDV